MHNLSRRVGAVVCSLFVLAVSACGGTNNAANTDTFTCPNGGTVRMGVEPFEDASTLIPLYQQVVDQLSTKLGCKVQLNVTSNYTAEVEAMRAKTLEVGEFGPLGYVFAKQLAHAEPVATFADKSGQPLTYYASIVTWAGSPITSLSQVSGKKFAYSDPASTSGHLFPAYALSKAGIDPDTGVQAIYAGSHTSAFQAIKNKKVDAGELNSDRIAAATKSGEYSPDKFPTLWKSDPIPQDPITVRGDLPASFKKKFTEAMLAIDLSTINDPKGILIGPKFVAQTDAPYKQISDLVSVLHVDITKL